MPLERSQVSLHEVKAYLALKTADGWLTGQEIADLAGINVRTARSHASRLVQLGVADQQELFPAYRYRLSEKAKNRNLAYVQRVEQACEVFGLSV